MFDQAEEKVNVTEEKICDKHGLIQVKFCLECKKNLCKKFTYIISKKKKLFFFHIKWKKRKMIPKKKNQKKKKIYTMNIKKKKTIHFLSKKIKK